MRKIRNLVRNLTLVTALVTGNGFVSAGAQAQQINGNSLYEACRSENSVMAGFCIGYLIGVIEGRSIGAFQVLARLESSENTEDANSLINHFLGHCIPDTASNEQLRDVAVEYLSKNPSIRHETARMLVWQAYVEAFPCQ